VLPEDQTVLGLAHAQVVVRPPRMTPSPHRRHTEESQVWEVSARQVGRPPVAHCWVHVNDQASDLFAYLVTCVDLDKHFVVRAYQNRVLVGDEAADGTARHLMDEVRRWPPHPAGDAVVDVPARPHQPARPAQVVLQWAPLTIAGGSHVRADLAPLDLWAIRVWEPAPPANVDPLEWVLLTDRPLTTVEDAQ